MLREIADMDGYLEAGLLEQPQPTKQPEQSVVNSLLSGYTDSAIVDPMASPFFFKTGIGGDDTSTQNSYRDSIFSQVLAGVPGMEQFYRASPGGDDTSAAGINPELLKAWLEQNGYSLRNASNTNGGRVWAEDSNGNLIGTAQDYSNQDTNFGIASSLLGAAGGSFIGAASGLGSMASGALSGGMAAGAQDPDLSSIGKGALLGGAIGGVTDYLGSTPTYEAGGQSAAPWANQGSAPAWYQEMTQQSVAPWASSSPSLMGGIGGTLGSLPEVPAPSDPMPTNAESGITTAEVPTIPAVPGATGGGLLEYLKANPRLVAGLAGGLLGGAEGGASGGYSYSGQMPTISRGGWSPTATPTYAQPAAQKPLNIQQGQANSGLWRYMLGGWQ